MSQTPSTSPPPLRQDSGASGLPPMGTVERVEATLGRLQHLSELLDVDEHYDVPPPSYPLPAEFLLTIVVPVYNERQTLYRILSRVTRLPIRKEIIIVDDCSSDGTRDLLRPLENAADVRIVYKPVNQGKGAALRTGFASARGDVVMVQDADLEYDPRDIPKLLQPIIAGEADAVYGSRFLEQRTQSSSSLHRLGNQLLTWASNRTTGLRLTDMETCYKLIRREMLTKVDIQQNRFGFEPEVTAKLARLNCRFQERPIGYACRGWNEGKKIGLRDAFNALYCIVRYGWSD